MKTLRVFHCTAAKILIKWFLSSYTVNLRVILYSNRRLEEVIHGDITGYLLVVKEVVITAIDIG